MSNLTAIVTCLALLLYVVLFARVATERAKYNILAPATTGHPAFERAFRIHANTGEQLVIFLPGLWLFSLYIAPLGEFTRNCLDRGSSRLCRQLQPRSAAAHVWFCRGLPGQRCAFARFAYRRRLAISA